MPPLHSLSALLQVTSISQKEAYLLTWGSKFCDCSPGHTSESPGFVAGRAPFMVPQHCIYLHVLKLQPKVWPPISVHLGAEPELHPFSPSTVSGSD